MDAQRLQGLAFLLSAAALGMPGCDPDDEGASSGSSTGSTGSTSGGSTSGASDSSAEEDGSGSGDATVCERWGARYVDCYPGYASIEEASASCVEHIAYLADVSQECSDTYVVWVDCLSHLECSELQPGCLEEATAHASLLCLGHG